MRLGETPVPIPNTMVKPFTADGTALATVWESRWMPDQIFTMINREQLYLENFIQKKLSDIKIMMKNVEIIAILNDELF